MADAVIVAAARTPIGRAFKGSLTTVRPDDLVATAIRAALDKVPALDPATLDDIYVGCADPRDEQGGNMARRVAVLLGLDNVPAATINRFCASSVQTARMAFHAIRSGEGQAFVSAGVESVSRYVGFNGAGLDSEDTQHPAFGSARERSARYASTNDVWHDPRLDGELPDIYLQMGQTAENVATLRRVSRRDQDEFAVLSQSRAERAIKDGFFAREIAPITRPDGLVVDADDCPRPGTTYEKLASLPPVFRPDGTVTAGNCTPLNDGAAALIIMSSVLARDLVIEPLGRIVSTGTSALSPEIMGLGPVEASRRALARAGLSIRDIDLVEINEAFAAQVLPSAWDLGVDVARLNAFGGAIALGHPFGATGARIMTTLMHGLAERDGLFGLETMCVGGGQGMAIVLERLS
jgi:acetyl-CoA C-acetyltransferase